MNNDARKAAMALMLAVMILMLAILALYTLAILIVKKIYLTHDHAHKHSPALKLRIVATG